MTEQHNPHTKDLDQSQYMCMEWRELPDSHQPGTCTANTTSPQEIQ